MIPICALAAATLTAAAITAPAITGVVDAATAAPVATQTPLSAPPPAAAATPPSQAASAAPCAATAKACVWLSRNQAWLTNGHGHSTYGPVPIAGGTPAYPTPTGTFHVLSKDANYHSTEFHNAPMPYSVFFYPGDAFHADNVHQKSHGCIHLTMTDAKIFFTMLDVGDEVQILP